MSVQELKTQAMQLSREEIAQLTHELIELLQASDSTAQEVEAAWLEVSLGRLEAFERGEMGAYSREEAFERAKSLASR